MSIKNSGEINKDGTRTYDEITVAEQDMILNKFNSTKNDYPRNKTINQLFEEQVERTPENIAVVFKDKQLTYRQLNEKSNQLARMLRNKGVNTDAIIGLMIDRSLEMIIGIMGILKSGAAYLPIDPDTPKARIDYILRDSHTMILLTQEKFIKKIEYDLEIINLDELDSSDLSTGNLKHINRFDDTAYIIYTSGSTGIPKGVIISHYSAIRVVRNTNYIEINNNDTILQLSNYSFDGSIFDIYGALLNGAKLVVIEKDTVTDINKLGNIIKQENINVMFITTALFNALVDIKIDCLINMRKILFGGERISVSHARKALEFLGKDKLIHVYGPTESTVFATYYFINEIDEDVDTLPIGKPLANTSVYIVDEKKNLLPIGEPGELCISGDGLTKGYLNNEQLTLEKFVKNPFAEGERLYRTGDLARWLPDGNIEFIGRIDHQVKVRGFRIELGEIESQLLKHPNVKETVVVAREEKDKSNYICAYLTLVGEVTVEELRKFLGEKLPDYMIPTYFLKLDKMPLTANGKIDKKSLPEPDRSFNTEVEYEEPRSEIEKQLVLMWQETLNINKVGINDSFAVLGGHSINAMELLSKMNDRLSVDLPLKELFRLSTIKKISAYIETNKGEIIENRQFTKTTDLKNLHEPFPLTGIQLAYLIGRDPAFEIGGAATNLTVEFEIDINIDRFNSALQKLINRHPILRTIVFENGTQRILEGELLYSVDTVDVRHLNQEDIMIRILEQRQKMIAKIIDPSTWPLFEIKAFILPNNQKYFCLNIDPLICDDSSMKILIKEFKMFYNQPSLQLPELEYNFRDYVLATNEFRQSNRYKKDEKYWLNKLDNFPSAPALPLKCNPLEIEKPTFNKCSEFLERETWNRLKQKAREKNLTPTSVLCAAYAYVLAYWSNQSQFAVNLTVFNRIPFHQDVKKIIGDFTTLMLLDINAKDSIESFWKFAAKVQDTLLEALEHRHYDGVDFIRAIGKKHRMVNQAIMPIVFTSVLSEDSDDSFNHLIDFEKIKFFSTRTSQVYIDNQVYELNGGLYITWDYVEQLFEINVIKSMFEQYINVLNQVIFNDQVSGINLSENSIKVIETYNDTNKKFDKCTLHEMFVNRAKLVPDKVAVIHHDDSITYKELNEKSNQIARYLMDKGVRKGDYIGVIGKRCIDTIINLFAVLKAGAAYIPLDPDYPEERKEYIKKKSNCKFFITPSTYKDENIREYSGDEVNIKVDETDMAYVIFTSGSTGKPKGVQITHGAATNTIIDINEKFCVTENDKIMGISSLCFDLSVYDVFGALSCGAALVIIDDQRDVYNLKKVVKKEGITIWNSVPAIMELTVDLYNDSEQDDSLRLVLLSGDWIPLELPQKIKKTFKNAEVISLGGATEGSIWSIYYPIKEIKDDWKSIPYGMPLANQKIYVLNQNKQLCPVDVEGELYIGGVGVASGYINDIEKTKMSFILHEELGYIYKTGDYGVLKEDGYVEFLGRKDSQVKIRGYRVELGEIENCIIKYKGVNKTVVIDYTNDNKMKSLYAFVVSDEDINPNELKQYLQNQLPNYMIPSRFFKIDEIPLTVNGKVNKSILGELIKNHELDEVAATTCEESENETQAKILDIWKDVFEIENIGIDTNYYEIGGDSLKAISIVTEIKKRMNIEVPIGEIFKNDTIKVLDQYLKNSQDNHRGNRIERVSKKDYYATSPSQKRMYMLSMMENNRGAYHIPMALLVEGEIECNRLEKAFRKFIDRHEILRTGFEVLDNELVQRVYDKVDFDLEYQCLDIVVTDDEGLRDLTSKMCKESTKPFDLNKPSLMRAKLIKIGVEKHILVVNFHHIIADGVSQGIFMNEILDLYNNLDLPKINIQYKDYVEWNNTYNQSNAIKKQEQYWLNLYSHLPSKLELPYDYRKENIDTFAGENAYFHIEKELSEQIRRVAKDTGSTLYMLMLSAYHILLHKYTGKTDIVVGTAASGRLHQDLQNIFGVFVNTIALRNNIDATKSFKEILEQVKENTITAFENSEYQFDELIRSIDYERDSNRNPLFDTMFVLEDAKLFTKKQGALNLSPIIFELDNAKFDITFNILDYDDEIVLNVEYSTGLFKRDTILRMTENYINILREISGNLSISVNKIDMIPQEEKRFLLYEHNDTNVDFSKNQLIHKLFEEQVERTPDSIAVVFEDKQLTYRELNEKSNQLARALRENGVGSDKIVGILLERSVDVIVGIMGILKAGGAYLPIDPTYPIDRIKYILQDSQTEILLTQDKLINLVDCTEVDDISIINIHNEHLFKYGTENLRIDSSSKDLVYVIYTSGSTGKPKGVMVEHHSLVNLCNWHNSFNKISETDKNASYASISFDAFAWEVFPYIIAGSEIHIINDNLKLDITKLNKYFIEKEISISFLPTQVCEQFLMLENTSLRRLLTGGDKLNYFENKSYQIVNNYGPTENSVVTTSFIIENSYDNIPIGKPICNTKVFILNESNGLCPLGVPGELCISGEGLARGYLNRPELTAEKFISNPFIPGERMYRTGDLVRMLPDGNIEFLGRIDHQVKIRGFRIELGEIESQLLKHKEVKEAVVIAREDNNNHQYLCAYFTSETSKGETRVQEIRKFLTKELPEYMIPAFFVQLDKLPLTTNGKVDRKALPSPDGSSVAGVVEYEAPRNTVEEKLVSIWQDILDIENIGIQHNFFEIGGHSLKATTMVSRIHKELMVEIPLGQIFQVPTIKEIGEFINSTKESVYASIKKVEEQDYYPLSSAQRRLYILNKIEGSGVSYNMPFAMKIKGDLDVHQLEQAFRKLIERHESLRTSFVMVDGEPVQKIEKDINFQVTYREMGTNKLDDIINGFVKPFDLEKAPLLRVEIIHVTDDEHVMVLDMHHIISDGVSMGIFMQELAELYNGQKLSPLSIQYKDYSEWQRGLFTQEEITKQEKYWMNVFNEEVPVLNMPTDYKRPKRRSFAGDRINLKINSETYNQLNKLATENEVTMYMLMLAGYTTLLSKYSGQEDIVVGSPIAGRKHVDLNNVMGMFVNTLAMRNYPKGNRSFREYLKEVKENTLKAYENQDYQFEELVEKVNVRRDISRNPLFDTMLVFQHTDNMLLNLDGLKVSMLEDQREIVKFDITIHVSELEDGLGLEIEYCTALYKKETIERFLEHFINVLREVVENPEQKLSEIDILTEKEKSKLLNEFNNTKGKYAKEKTLPELFEEQVEKTPNNVALVFENQSITYKELNERANSLAHILREKGVGPDVVTGIMVERSIEMIVGIMGILKAGGAYLPIDPTYPRTRKEYMLRNSHIEILCVTNEVHSDISFHGQIIQLDKLEYKENRANISKLNSPRNLAYVIYTSGSTGNPKGVMIEQNSVNNLVNGLNDVIYKRFNTNVNVALLAPFIFDASVKQIFATLLLGHTLFVVPKEVSWNAMSLIEYYATNKIHVSDATPAHLTMLSYVNKIEQELEIKEFIVGGEALTPYLIKGLFGKFADFKPNITNVYGPTECCVDSTSYRIEFDQISGDKVIPIGKPILNTNIYIIDKGNNLQPIGVAGELCVSGEGIARGYLNNLELTAERFIENPFNNGKSMYRTGDLARWLPDGNIEFLGRIDHQVKIRGYRIELGEIESQLSTHQDIEETIVIAREDKESNQYLCAYIVSQKELHAREIREYLEQKLPDYMIPGYFVKLDKLPLTTNGKVDRKALPEPDGSINTGVEYEEPRNEVEEKLVEIWRSIIGIEDIGINHNFFVSGGDSIKAIQIISRLSRIGLKLEMKDLFANPKIKNLGKYIKREKKEQKVHEIVNGEVELTPIQSWYFEKNQEEIHHFNQSFMLFRENGFDEKQIEEVFNKIMEHHDALRMIYKEKEGEIIQYNRGYDKNLFDLYIHDVKGVENKEEKVYEIATNIQKEMDIKEGKLVKLCIFKSDEGDHLLIAIHHLVVDGVSWRILLEDLETLYSQLEKGEKLEIGFKTDSYKEFASKLKAYSVSRELMKEREYWTSISKENVQFIPKKKEITKNNFENSSTVSITLDKELTTSLLRNTNRAYNTEINDILLTALAVGTRELTGKYKLKVNMEGHGREDVIENFEINRTVGWFTTMYPVLLDIGNENELSTNIKTVKETLRKIPNKGIGYGVLKHLAKDKGFMNEEKAPISFNYLGELDQDINRREFSASKWSIGETVGKKINRNTSIEMNSMVLNGELVIHTTFNKLEYSEKMIKDLNQKYKESLEMIINHCANKVEPDQTPFDYGDINITLEELEEIKEKYNGFIIEKIYPLANMQKGMLFHALEDKNSSMYFEQIVMDIKGTVDVDILEKSFNTIMRRHEILRAAFEYELVEEPRHVILQDRKVGFKYYDIQDESIEQKTKFIENYLQNDKQKGFNLSEDTLMRISLIQMNQDSYKLVWSHHHILLDGWCLGIILGELFDVYGRKMKGEDSHLAEPTPYSDYIRWLEEQDKEEGLAHWKSYLDGYEEQAQVPKILNKVNEYKRKEKMIEFSKEMTRNIIQLANRNQVTFNTVLQAIWGILLARYNNIEDVVFGTVVSGREAKVEGIEAMVGLFINTIPTRVKMEKDSSFKEVLRNVQDESIENNKYNYINLAEIQSLHDLKRNLIDHVMVFQNYSLDDSSFNHAESNTGFMCQNIRGEEQTNYGFNIVAIPGEQLVLKLTYNEKIYPQEIIDNIEMHLKKVTEQVVINEDKKLNEIDIIPEKERDVLLYRFNDTKTNYPKDKTIHQLFEEQVEKTPNHIAVEFEGTKMTYQELNERSNQVARWLRDKGITANTIVGIMVERSPEMIIGIMGILKSGSAYLPIDPKSPQDRIKFMIQDSDIQILLTQEKFINDSSLDVEMVSLDKSENFQLSKENLAPINDSQNIAYIIYTSGSTGVPKGVVTSHSNAVRVVRDTNYIKIDADDIILQLSNYSFDGSVFDIYGALLNGAKLVMVSIDTVLNLSKLTKLIKEEKISVMFITTALFNTLVDLEIECLSNVRKILFGGERISVSHTKRALEYLGKDKLIHVYGPTESTVFATYYCINEINEEFDTIPIGKPLANTSAFIVDGNQRLLPIGVAGELCLSGAGLAHGYLNRPDLTAEKFVSNPFIPEEKMYRTGDLVRMLPDGNIEFLGRIDHQVKVRGFRIELGEIESQLLKYKKVKEAIVIVRDDIHGEKYICAYFTSETWKDELIIQEIRKYLTKKLPEYMIPAFFVQLDKLPLTTNGKVDRKSLPKPDGNVTTEVEYVPPSNFVEETIISIWEEILGIKSIGISHNFFEIGGNSLKLMSAVSAINKVLNTDISIHNFFENPSVMGLANYILSTEHDRQNSSYDYVEEEV
ncbi:amino acid adenylation domain-containing protein [Bacillus sp. TK-2]|nr:amino acid adenylation domain-containing protein [Bacillus sp. TK-2]